MTEVPLVPSSSTDRRSSLNHEEVNHPSHYGGDTLYETIKVLENRMTPQEFIGFLKGNVYKYNDRAKSKGSELNNYEKAQFYQNYLVDFMRRKGMTK